MRGSKCREIATAPPHDARERQSRPKMPEKKAWSGSAHPRGVPSPNRLRITSPGLAVATWSS